MENTQELKRNSDKENIPIFFKKVKNNKNTLYESFKAIIDILGWELSTSDISMGQINYESNHPSTKSCLNIMDSVLYLLIASAYSEFPITSYMFFVCKLSLEENGNQASDKEVSQTTSFLI